MKEYVVIGLGNFGYSIATKLASKGHQVLAIDSDSERVDDIKDKVTDAIAADVRNKRVLREYIGKNVDAVIVSVGESMEASILATHYLKELGIRHIIVKAISDDHAKLLKITGADEVIFPEKDMAAIIAQRLTTYNLLEHIPLTSDYSIVEIAVPDKFAGKTLKDIQLRVKYDVLVLAVKEILMDKIYLMPDGNFKITPDCLLVLMGKSSVLNNLQF